MQKFAADEIVIEIDHPKASDVYFHPVEFALRSRLYLFRLNGGLKPWMNSYGQKGIPGQRVHLDVAGRVGRIVDSLSDPEHAELLKKLQRDLLENTRQAIGPHKTKVYDRMSDSDVSTWLYWMRRLVDDVYKMPLDDREAEERREMGTKAKLLCGNLPSLDDIVARGNVRRPVHDPRGIRHSKGETEFYAVKVGRKK